MEVVFYGDWSLQVVQKTSDFSQRFIVRDSDSGDGIYPGVVDTTTITVRGTEWVLIMEWNDNVSPEWHPSNIQKSSDYSVQEGLVINLGADDNTITAPDLDYDDIILKCVSLDPALNPLPLLGNIIDFTISEDMLYTSEAKLP